MFLKTITVNYRWHPLFGQKLRVLSHAKISAGNEIVCQRSDGSRAVLPLWMLNPKCAEFALGHRMEALVELRRFLTFVQSRAACGQAFVKDDPPQGIDDE